MDLTNAARSPTDKDDKFAETMGAFCQQARKECEILQAMAQKMTELYSSLAEYFVFDRQKYTLEEFMGDIKTFKDQYKKAYDGILKDREAEAKQQRAREAREKQDRERAERAAKKKALVDFNAPDDQEGVMDSLLEALKTGSAFNRDQKRKRQRATGAERRAQLNRSRSRGPSGMTGTSPQAKEIVDILMDEQENDPNSATGRPSRSRRPRPVSSSISTGRERDFSANNGMINGILPGAASGGAGSVANPELSADVSGVAAAASNAQEETDALLRKLRNL